jgi:fatty-acyl-CoA synthase
MEDCRDVACNVSTCQIINFSSFTLKGTRKKGGKIRGDIIMQMQPEGIGSWLKYREIVTPQREAVVVDGKRFSYKQLNRWVNQLSAALQARGIKHGDRVGVLAYNGIEFVEIIMALAKLGLILVPLNWRLTAT